MSVRFACAVAVAVALGMPAPASALDPGSLDPSFGAGGTVATPIGDGGPESTAATTVAVAPDGRIVVGGWARAGGRDAFALARYLPDGRLDPEFGNSGTVVAQLGVWTQRGEGGYLASKVSALVLEADGGVVAVGSASRSDAYSGVGVLRLDPAGREMWRVVHQLGVPQSKGSEARAVVRQPDGRLVITGAATSEPDQWTPGYGYNHVVARLLGDGSLDRSFAGTGFVLEQRPPASGATFDGDAMGHAVALTPSGSVLVGGMLVQKGGAGIRGHSPILRRYGPDGTRDESFPRSGPLRGITDFAPGPGGELMMLGYASQWDPAVARHLSSGEQDPAFAPPGGYREAVAPAARFPVPAGVAVQPDGRVLVAYAGYPGDVVRLRADGTGDDSFGFGGFGAGRIRVLGKPQLIPSGGNPLALQPDGRIVIAGTPPNDDPDSGNHAFSDPGGREFAVSRLIGGNRAAPPPPPPPPPATPLLSGRVAIARSATVRGRTALLSLTCTPPGAAACAGTVEIASAFAGRRKPRVRFGRATFSIPSGTSATVRVALSRTARRRLRRATGHRLTVRVEATSAGRRPTLRRVELSGLR